MNGRPSSGRRSRLRPTVTGLVRAACYLSLVSMALMVWSVLDPTPFPVMVSMSVGQAIGTLALLAYLGAVIAAQQAARKSLPPPSTEPPTEGGR